MRCKIMQNMLLCRIQYSVFPMRSCYRMRKMCIVRNKMSAVSKTLRTGDESVFFVEQYSSNLSTAYVCCCSYISHNLIREQQQIHKPHKRYCVVTQEKNCWCTPNFYRITIIIDMRETPILMPVDTLNISLIHFLFEWPHNNKLCLIVEASLSMENIKI